MVWNGDFALGQNFWSFWTDVAEGSTAPGSFTGGQFSLATASRGTKDWQWQLNSPQKNLMKGQKYTVSFEGQSTATDIVRVNIREGELDINGDGKKYSDWNSQPFTMTNVKTTYSYTFTMDPAYDDPQANITFYLGATTGTITIDNVSMKPQI
jgi:hypothetical protein